MIQSIGLFPSIFWGMTIKNIPIYDCHDMPNFSPYWPRYHHCIPMRSPFDHSTIPSSLVPYMVASNKKCAAVLPNHPNLRSSSIISMGFWKWNEPWHGLFSDGVFLAVGATPWRGAALGAFDLARSARSDSRAMSISWWWNPPAPSRDVHGISLRGEKIWSCSRLGNDGSSMMVGSHDGFIMELFTMMVGC